MDFELQDRTVLITGATGGIGAAVARAYAAEGARVAIGYASDAEAAGKLAAELGAAHDRAFAVRCRIGADAAAGEPAGAAAADGSADGSAESAVAAVTERWGGVDALVVCAMEPGGLRPPTAPFESLDPEHWAGFVSANLSHNLRLAQLTLPHMRRSGWGRIVLVSSVVARLGKPGREFYGTVKSGLHGFTRSLMWDLRDTGVLVNLVSPGLTLTPDGGRPARRPPRRGAAGHPDRSPEHSRGRRHGRPVPRFGRQPEHHRRGTHGGGRSLTISQVHTPGRGPSERPRRAPGRSCSPRRGRTGPAPSTAARARRCHARAGRGGGEGAGGKGATAAAAREHRRRRRPGTTANAQVGHGTIWWAARGSNPEPTD